MIDLADLRNRPDVYKKAVRDKGFADDIDVDAFLKLDEERRALVQEIGEMRAEKNKISRTVPAMKGAEREGAVAEMKELGLRLAEKEGTLKEVEDQWKERQLWLPSLPLETVPVGKDEHDNVETKKWGAVPAFDFEPKDHVALGESLGIIDIPRGVKVAGARSYLLRGDGARLEQAVLQYTIGRLVEKGFTLVSPPVMASWRAFMGMGHFPDSEEQTYAVGVEHPSTESRVRHLNGEGGSSIGSDNLFLVGTSEAALLASHADEVLAADELPKRYAGVSACFRREAGTYGKDTKGLYRVHQFQKVEQVVFCEADQNAAMRMFEEIRMNAEEVLRALKLPHRIVTMCTGDMGQGKVFMQDIETWMPSRNAYCETHSCSYLGDFQSRRLNIKYEDASGEKRYVHTLNNTCIASPRILIPILEICQNADGSVTVPEVLRPYMNGQDRIAA